VGARGGRMSARITVGISFLNPGPQFALTLQSVFAQSFEDWELVLVDDGSTDGSGEFAERLDDPRVRLLRDGQRRGIAVRLNQITQLVRTPWLARMDADDLMHPRRLERQVAELSRRDDNTVVGSDAYALDAKSRAVGYKQVQKVQQFDFAARHSFFHPTVAASIKWFRRNPYSQDPLFFRSEDAELWCRTTGTSTFFNLPEPLLFYREAGVFSFRNYAATQLGLLGLLDRRYREPRGRCARLMARELLKVWVAGLCDLLGAGDRLVARRSRPLTAEELSSANEDLERIRNQHLPLRESAGIRRVAA
jgi:hypothetical protein